MHHHNLQHPSEDEDKLKKVDDISVDGKEAEDLHKKMASASLHGDRRV